MKDKKTVYPHTEQSILGNIDKNVTRIYARLDELDTFMKKTAATIVFLLLLHTGLLALILTCVIWPK